jgi:SAM-dependent methyltransferase
MKQYIPSGEVSDSRESSLQTYFNKKLGKHIDRLVSLWRGGHGSMPLSNTELQKAGSSLLSLQRGLTGDRHLAGVPYMEDGGLLGAYLLYYWPVSYMQTGLAAACCRQFFHMERNHAARGGTLRSLKILDLGSGPGPASAAFSDYCAFLALPEPVLFLADGSRKALHLASAVLGSPDKESRTGPSVSLYEADLERLNLPGSFYGAFPAGPFDIIVLSHVLNELWKGDSTAFEKKLSLLEEAVSVLSPGGFLFLAEPALLETSRNLLKLRDVLALRGFTILAPCTGSSPCPALAAGTGDTCHAEAAWDPPEPAASLARIAGLDRRSVKMTFIAAVPASAAPAAAGTGSDGIIRARVVSDAMLNKAGRVRYLLCDGVHRFPVSAKKDDIHALGEQFFSLRRYDLVEIVHPEIRGTGTAASSGVPALGFAPESHLRTVSRFGE